MIAFALGLACGFLVAIAWRNHLIAKERRERLQKWNRLTTINQG